MTNIFDDTNSRTSVKSTREPVFYKDLNRIDLLKWPKTPKMGFGDFNRGNSFLASKTIIICFRSQNTSIRKDMFFYEFGVSSRKPPLRTLLNNRAAISIYIYPIAGPARASLRSSLSDSEGGAKRRARRAMGYSN